MENLRALKDYKDMSTDELVKSIDDKLAYLMDCYDGILTQQEILHIKSLSIEEMFNVMLQNQKEMRNKLDILLERGDKKWQI